ncbi:MAG: Uma2 family endonuclease [Nannocystaceae bacterium]
MERRSLRHGGASYAHNLVKDTLARVLGNLITERGCRVLTSDMRVRIPSRESYVYPDVVVLCGPPSSRTTRAMYCATPRS